MNMIPFPGLIFLAGRKPDFSGCERAGLVWRHRWSWVIWRERSERFGLCVVKSASDGRL